MSQCSSSFGKNGSTSETNSIGERKAIPLNIRHFWSHFRFYIDNPTGTEWLYRQLLQIMQGLAHQSHSSGVLCNHRLLDIPHPRSQCEAVDDSWINEPDRAVPDYQPGFLLRRTVDVLLLRSRRCDWEEQFPSNMHSVL